MNRMNRRHAERTGFTLVEMMLVVVIIGILATVVVVKFGGEGERARKAACRGSIANIGLAVDQYEVHCGKYPSSLDNLVKSSGEPNWHGPYVAGGLSAMTDQWGTPFQYTAKGENEYEIRSAGPDRAMNSEDDLTNFTSDSK